MTYCAPKAAVIMMTSVAAGEWAHLGIRVNAIAPGVLRTPMWDADVARGAIDEEFYLDLVPAKRLGTTEDVGRLAVYLASDALELRQRLVHHDRRSAHLDPRRVTGPRTDQGDHVLPYGIHHTGYTVSNLERSLDFYHGLLGLEIVGQQEKQGGYLGAIVGYPDAHVKQAHLRVPGSEHVVELFEYVAPEGTAPERFDAAERRHLAPVHPDRRPTGALRAPASPRASTRS